MFTRVRRRNRLLSKRNIAAQLRFAKSLNKPQDLCNKVLWRVCFADTGSGHLAVNHELVKSQM